MSRCLALDVATAEIVSALDAAGIESVLLKGPATVRWLYRDDPGLRFYSDIDLLVAPAQFDAAADVVAALGFRDRFAARLRESEAARLWERAWVRGPEEMVELHRSFCGVDDPTAFWTAMRAHTASLPVASRTVAAPDQAAGALLYALHAAAHGTARQMSAKPLEDLRRAVEVFDEPVWREAAGLADAVGAAGPFVVGLGLDPGGARLVDALGLCRAASPAVWVRAGAPPHHGAGQLARLADARSMRARWAVVRDAIVPSPAVLMAARPLARHGRAGLAAAYPQQWCRVVLGTVQAAAHWQRATAAARRSGWAPASGASTAPGRGRVGRAARRGVRLVRRCGGRDPAAAWWSVRALRAARRQVGHGRDPSAVELPPLPEVFVGQPDRIRAGAPAVRAALDRLSPSCLESAVVRQRWLAEAGVRRDLVVGVTAPATGFRAHAWLDGDLAHDGFTELVRHPPPRPRLPNFVLIGAAKAGTTSLWSYLRAHPQVFMTEEKEPEYFLAGRNWQRGQEWYERLFERSADAVAVGEASVRYTSPPPRGEGVAQRMAAVLPDAKLIFLVRDPVRRMVSQWQHNQRIGSERLPLDHALRTSRYTEPSRYAERLEPYLAHYLPERILVVVSERLRDDRAATLAEIFAFLGVDAGNVVDGLDVELNQTSGKRMPRPWMQAAMRARGTHRAWAYVSNVVPASAVRVLDRLTHGPVESAACPPGLAAELAGLFADDVRRLRPYVRGSFDGWGIA